MKSEDLHEDQQVARIFLRALREFSESCTPPSLQHSCPFAIEIGPGQRGCGEECMDLLGRFGAPPPTEETILENGLTVRKHRRPRPRHSSTRSRQPFDARAEYLTQRDSLPKPQWSLQSLFFHVKEIAMLFPGIENDVSDRLNEVHTSKLLMEARGISFLAHVEPSIRKTVVMNLSANVTAALSTDQSARGLDIAAWTHYVESTMDVPRARQAFADTPRMLQVMSILGPWAETASLEDVLACRVPETSWTDLMGQGMEPRREEPSFGDGVWLWDRFTETYVDRWNEESMKREWAYIHGQQPIPCSPYELKSREVNEAELAMIMADRLAREKPRRPRKVDSALNLEMMTHQLVGPAARFLREGRLTEARALFEAILQTDSENSDANNNLGFCWIPEDPELALKYFDATSKATHRSELVAVNRMLSLAKLGKLTALHDIAADIFGLELPAQEVEVPVSRVGAGSYLWDVDSILIGSTPSLIEFSDLKSYAQYIFWRVSDLSGSRDS